MRVQNLDTLIGDPGPGHPILDCLTPELALVCPELGARARALLPERPWELLTPAGAPSLASQTVAIGTQQSARGRTVPGSRRTARRLLVAALPMALAVAGLVWAAERPPAPFFLAPEVELVERPSAAATITRAAREPDLADPASPGPAPAPLGSGGYVFEGGVVVADAEGLTVTVVLSQGCAANASTPPLRVADGRFSYHGRPDGAAGVTLDVEGQFVAAETSRVRIAARGTGCPPGSQAFVARLS